jgi:hypothetical protein
VLKDGQLDSVPVVLSSQPGFVVFKVHRLLGRCRPRAGEGRSLT